MLGRVLLTVDSLFLIIASVVADWSDTHIYNPRWPPHAKFHNGQTMTLSVLLGLATLFYTWRPFLPGNDGKAATRLSPELARDSLRTAAFTGSIYWLAGLAADFFPGASGLDPEFGGPGFPQAGIFVACAVMALGGWALEP